MPTIISDATPLTTIIPATKGDFYDRLCYSLEGMAGIYRCVGKKRASSILSPSEP